MYSNDYMGAPAYDPAILLKIVLHAYSKGIFTSRKIAQCCEYPERSQYRQVHYFIGKNSDTDEPAYIELMKAKIDSDQGRAIYGKRIGTIEPVFAHIRTTLRLDRFTLRGNEKVSAQWSLYSILHNLKKIHSYGH